jgi:hypothetical protein
LSDRKYKLEEIILMSKLDDLGKEFDELRN